MLPGGGEVGQSGEAPQTPWAGVATSLAHLPGAVLRTPLQPPLLGPDHTCWPDGGQRERDGARGLSRPGGGGSGGLPSGSYGKPTEGRVQNIQSSSVPCAGQNQQLSQRQRARSSAGWTGARRAAGPGSPASSGHTGATPTLKTTRAQSTGRAMGGERQHPWERTDTRNGPGKSAFCPDQKRARKCPRWQSG